VRTEKSTARRNLRGLGDGTVWKFQIANPADSSRVMTVVGISAIVLAAIETKCGR